MKLNLDGNQTGMHLDLFIAILIVVIIFFTLTNDPFSEIKSIK